MFRRVLYLILLFPLIVQANPTTVEFYQGSLSVAKNKAAQEGKLYLVDFVANWCMPCRWMDETTFSDARVAQYLKQHYIPVKVDIDDFDGYAYKQQYNVRVLPTILIFNSKGEVVGRYQESLAPSKMIQILAEHNTAANRVATARPQAPVISQPTSHPLNVRPNTRPSTYNSDTAPALPAPSPSPSVNPNSRPAMAPSTAANSLYRFSVQAQDAEGFSVQVGVYGEYGNVLREVAKLENQFQEPVVVHIAELKGKTVYKILVGVYTARTGADTLKAKLQQNGFQGLVKDLATM